MRTNNKLITNAFLIVGGLMLSACGSSSHPANTDTLKGGEKSGPWSLVQDESGMSFVTIKKGSLAELGTFTALDGKVAEDGNAEFTIVIDSVDTNNETRDPRMRQFLFETDKHPYITAKASLDLDEYSEMETGDRKTTLLKYELGMRGLRQTRESYVMVTRLGANKVLVENKAPVLVEASDFGLEAGVEKLRELAGLDSIAPVVPVTFSLVFER